MSDHGESQYLSVIRVWAALAWADGVIADAERAALKRLIGIAELSDDERAVALGWLDSRVELDTGNIASLSDAAKSGLYRAAVRLAGVDDDVAPEETSYLERLRDGLGLDAEVAAEIEKSLG